jgi:hypothetical protein
MKKKSTMSFQERAKLAMAQLSKQPTVTLEEAKAQAQSYRIFYERSERTL